MRRPAAHRNEGDGNVKKVSYVYIHIYLGLGRLSHQAILASVTLEPSGKVVWVGWGVFSVVFLWRIRSSDTARGGGVFFRRFFVDILRS